MKDLFKMNLQLFAEPGEGAAPDGAGNQPEGNGGQAPGQEQNQQEVQLTPEVLQMLEKREERARASALRGWAEQKGVTPETMEALIAADKAAKEANMTEAQREKARADAEAAKAASKDAAILRLQAQIKALSLGVKADALDDVIALAERGEGWKDDQGAAITAVLTRYPHFKTDAPAPGASGAYNPPGGGAGDRMTKQPQTIRDKIAQTLT